jgi:YHS domain-containing protein
VLGWLLRLLLMFLVVRALMLIVGGLIRGLIGAAQVPGAPRQRSGKGGVARSHGTLVQDPVCGTYVLQERALAIKTTGGTAFFCSERCRSAYDAQAARPR